RGVAGRRVVIEERLKGEEISVLAVCCGTTAVLIGVARDHKRLLDWDLGPNTGGMGAFSPVLGFGPDEEERVMSRIIVPTLEAMKAEGRAFSGVLYAGLMLTAEGPAVLEYNVRFGDPETQVILPRLQGDLLPFLLASASGDERKLGELGARATLKEETAVCVVMAKEGYPDNYEKGAPIFGLDAAESTHGVLVFHAGTKIAPDGRVVTDGGRVLGVVGTGRTMEEARRNAYRGVSQISFEGATYRRDIGLRLP
ncbi:MAG TPA: phosphoribosylamine--glycine ligase, partial [Clostridia bacterium]|nr:phosphoribosylamine--glycine ligase [Clostridia bacterium]